MAPFVYVKKTCNLGFSGEEPRIHSHWCPEHKYPPAPSYCHFQKFYVSNNSHYQLHNQLISDVHCVWLESLTLFPSPLFWGLNPKASHTLGSANELFSKSHKWTPFAFSVSCGVLWLTDWMEAIRLCVFYQPAVQPSSLIQWQQNSKRMDLLLFYCVGGDGECGLV